MAISHPDPQDTTHVDDVVRLEYDAIEASKATARAAKRE
jgi:hypothetical protein